MKITVILCTYNRCESLSKALDSLSHVHVPESDTWEILVVDNNSNDRTREVVDDFCRRFPAHFRYLFEPRQGKSRALNAGIGEARGDVLAFTDDDVTVEPGWLRNLTNALHDAHWVGVGGRTLPDQAFSTPHWVPLDDPDAFAPLAIFDPDCKAGPSAGTPYGVNMAYRRSAFEKYGLFRTDLGPGAGGVFKNEDSEFGHRLIVAGEHIRYEPSAIVYHAVTRERLERKYFLQWWFEKARADVRTRGTPDGSAWSVAGVPLFLIRRLALWTLRGMFRLDPRHRFSAQIKARINAGTIVESYRLDREARHPLERSHQAGY